MKRFRARDDDEKGAFEVESLRVIDAKTQGFVVKVVVVGVIVSLAVAVIVLAVRGDDVRLAAIVGIMSNLMSFVLGRYFDKGKGG